MMADSNIVRMKIDTTEGMGPYTVDVQGYSKASVDAVLQSSDVTTGVIEIKKAWGQYESTGVSFSPAKTLDASGAAPTTGLDVTDSPYLLFDVTTFQAGKSVTVVVYMTSAVSPV